MHLNVRSSGANAESAFGLPSKQGCPGGFESVAVIQDVGSDPKKQRRVNYSPRCLTWDGCRFCLPGYRGFCAAVPPEDGAG